MPDVDGEPDDVALCVVEIETVAVLEEEGVKVGEDDMLGDADPVVESDPVELLESEAGGVLLTPDLYGVRDVLGE